MRYHRVVWQHDLDDEPTVLWGEIGEDANARRKVDEDRDGVEHASGVPGGRDSARPRRTPAYSASVEKPGSLTACLAGS
jgi:hypothetical protein